MKKTVRWFDVPPLWLAAHLGGAYALARFAPLTGRVDLIGGPILQLVGWSFMAAGFALAIAAAVTLSRAKTTVIPHQRPSALVTAGPYRFSRNPIYLADAMLLVGFAGVIGSLWPLIATPLFMWIVSKRFIEPEEARLREGFPDAYAAWARRTRRWL